MAEEDIVNATSDPRTRESLSKDLHNLGIRAGMTMLVHSSLRSLGWVTGGPVAVIQALQDLLTDEGTLVMPTQTGNYSDPANWQNPPVPQPWWQILYDCMPAFDPLRTPTYLMGAIPETFRTWPGVVRSQHPTVSFAAWGKHAERITAGHAFDYGLGEDSPLARIYELAGWVLLLGVGHINNTSFHLAEYRIPGAQQVWLGSPVYEDGVRVWKKYRDIEIDADLFPEIGRSLETQTDMVKLGHVGSAPSRLFPQRPAVDFAVQWYLQHRS